MSYIVKSRAYIMYNKDMVFLKFSKKQYFELFSVQTAGADKKVSKFIHFMNMMQKVTIYALPVQNLQWNATIGTLSMCSKAIFSQDAIWTSTRGCVGAPFRSTPLSLISTPSMAYKVARKLFQSSAKVIMMIKRKFCGKSWVIHS